MSLGFQLVSQLNMDTAGTDERDPLLLAYHRLGGAPSAKNMWLQGSLSREWSADVNRLWVICFAPRDANSTMRRYHVLSESQFGPLSAALATILQEHLTSLWHQPSLLLLIDWNTVCSEPKDPLREAIAQSMHTPFPIIRNREACNAFFLRGQCQYGTDCLQSHHPMDLWEDRQWVWSPAWILDSSVLWCMQFPGREDMALFFRIVVTGMALRSGSLRIRSLIHEHVAWSLRQSRAWQRLQAVLPSINIVSTLEQNSVAKQIAAVLSNGVRHWSWPPSLIQRVQHNNGALSSILRPPCLLRELLFCPLRHSHDRGLQKRLLGNIAWAPFRSERDSSKQLVCRAVVRATTGPCLTKHPLHTEMGVTPMVGSLSSTVRASFRTGALPTGNNRLSPLPRPKSLIRLCLL